MSDLGKVKPGIELKRSWVCWQDEDTDLCSAGCIWSFELNESFAEKNRWKLQLCPCCHSSFPLSSTPLLYSHAPFPANASQILASTPHFLRELQPNLFPRSWFSSEFFDQAPRNIPGGAAGVQKNWALPLRVSEWQRLCPPHWPTTTTLRSGRWAEPFLFKFTASLKASCRHARRSPSTTCLCGSFPSTASVSDLLF